MILLDKQIACLPTSPMAGVAARQPLFFYLNEKRRKPQASESSQARLWRRQGGEEEDLGYTLHAGVRRREGAATQASSYPLDDVNTAEGFR